MRSKVQRGAGRHRKIVTSQTTKGRIAVMTVAAGAVSTAGVGGAAAANVESDNTASTTTTTQSVDYKLAADTSEVNDAPAGSSDAAPQILNVAEAKPGRRRRPVACRPR
jgi:flagellar biosynthesis GTPase FlhF